MVAIDSLTILTPYKDFYNPPDTSVSLMTINGDTGEIIDEKPKPVVFDKYGIKIRAFEYKIFKDRYIAFTFTSKMLRENYLKGLTKSTLQDAFLFAQKALGFEINYLDFYNNSIALDIDFKKDVYQSDTEFTAKMLKIKELCKYVRIFKKKGNYLQSDLVSGLQFVNRKDATISKPFVKFYDKEDELLNNSREFYDNFIKNSSLINNLKRQEVTIKNVEHLRSVLKIGRDIKCNLLSYIFTLDKHDIELIIKNVTAKHFDDFNIKKPLTISENIPDFVRPRDFFIVMLMRELMLKGYSMKELFLMLNDYPALNPNTKSRIIRDIKQHYKRVIKYDELSELRITANDAFF